MGSTTKDHKLLSTQKNKRWFKSHTFSPQLKDGDMRLPFDVITDVERLKSLRDPSLVNDHKIFIKSMKSLYNLINKGVVILRYHDEDDLGKPLRSIKYPCQAHQHEISPVLRVYNSDNIDLNAYNNEANKFKKQNVMFDLITSFLGQACVVARSYSETWPPSVKKSGRWHPQYDFQALWMARGRLRYIFYIFPFITPFVLEFPDVHSPQVYLFFWLLPDTKNIGDMLNKPVGWMEYVAQMKTAMIDGGTNLKFFYYNSLFTISKWKCIRCASDPSHNAFAAAEARSHLNDKHTPSPRTPGIFEYLNYSLLYPHSGFFNPVGIWFARGSQHARKISINFYPVSGSNGNSKKVTKIPLQSRAWNRFVPHMRQEFLHAVTNSFSNEYRQIKYADPLIYNGGTEQSLPMGLARYQWSVENVERYSIMDLCHLISECGGHKDSPSHLSNNSNSTGNEGKLKKEKQRVNATRQAIRMRSAGFMAFFALRIPMLRVTSEFEPYVAKVHDKCSREVTCTDEHFEDMCLRGLLSRFAQNKVLNVDDKLLWCYISGMQE